MDRHQKVTLTNMCMLQVGDQVLTLNRTDPVWPGLTFPGGHVDLGESIHDSVVREMQEETGLTISDPQLVDIKEFNDDEDCRYLVFFYVAHHYTGKLQASAEGKLAWQPLATLDQQVLASHFEHDLPIFTNPQLSEHFWWHGHNQTV
ncbi:MAG: 8-oxo-dGTP diphosphatase [Lactobacillus sp.]